MAHESGSKGVYAKNPRSTAFGLGQLLIGNRIIYAKECETVPDTVDYDDQLCMARGYIRDRYGTSANAADHSRTLGWY